MIDAYAMKIASLVGAACCMGVGAIGPAYGVGYASSRGCNAIARQPEAEGQVIKTMLIGQAVTESPSIFALLVAFILLFNAPAVIGLAPLCALIGAGICMGAGAFGPGVGAGFANAEACEGVGRNPDSETVLLRTMLIGQAVSQSTSIYALVIALMLIYVV
ncbi:ATP synthase F0 subunit C [bacterium]|nr:ATP synthase F0 subunit C [bacterium]MCP5463034.1 ATP synthase F0 subunit C [bacterium]